MNPATLPPRIAARIQVDDSGCWTWTGHKNTDGYGAVWSNGSMRGAHRVVWEALVGPILDGQCLDHACHNGDAACSGGRQCAHRSCVNPAHLSPIARGANGLTSRTATAAINAAKTECPHGHPYSAENTIRVSNGRAMVRRCRTCVNAKRRERRAAA